MANFVSKYSGAQHDEAVRLTGELDGKVAALSEEMLTEDDVNALIDSKLEGAGGGGSVFVVNLSLDENWQITGADKTFDEIKAAIDAGAVVRCMMGKDVLALSTVNELVVVFAYSNISDGFVYFTNVSFYGGNHASAGTIRMKEARVAVTQQT